MRIIALAGLTWSLAASAATPETDAMNALALCRHVSDAEDRLVCFDAAMKGAPDVGDPSEDELARVVADARPAGPPDAFRPAVEGTGNWLVLREVDAMTQLPVITAMLSSDAGVGRNGQPVELVVRCDRGELLTYLEWGSTLPRGAEVTTLIGNREAEVAPWGLPETRDATFARGDLHDLLDRVAANERAVFAAQPDDGGPEVKALFDVRRFDRVWPELYGACPRER